MLKVIPFYWSNFRTDVNIATDYILPLAADVISGHFGVKIYDKFIGKTSTKLPKTVEKAVSEEPPVKTPEEIVPPEKQPEPDELTQKMKQITEEVPKEKLPEEKTKEVAETTADVIDEVDDSVDIDFNTALDLMLQNKLPAGKLIKIGKPSDILLNAGIPDKDIVLARKVIKNKIAKHELTKEDLIDFPKLLNNPVAVYQSPKNQNKVVLVPRRKGNTLLLTAIEANSKRRGNIEVNDIRTIYYKDVPKIIYEMEKSSSIDFLNKEKLSEFLRASAQSNSGQEQELREFIKNLVKKSKSVKLYAGIPTKDLFKHISSLYNKAHLTRGNLSA